MGEHPENDKCNRRNDPMPDTQDWMNTDQSPDNPYGKSTDYEGFLGYLGDLDRPLTPEIAAQPITINVPN